MKLGLDIHGTLDANPKDFISIADRVLSQSGEVHIITGPSCSDDIIEYLLNLSSGRVFWTKIVSVQDELMKTIPPVGINKHGHPCWEDKDWNSFKGKYCAQEKVDLHYDDSEEYVEYFTTPVVLWHKSTKLGKKLLDQ